MKLILFSFLIASLTFGSPQSRAISIQNSTEVFVGTTPCSNIIRPVLKISTEADCALEKCKCMMVEWKLTLHRDPVTQEPTHYKLTGVNRFTVRETNMYSQPGTKTETQGRWAIVKGTKSNPQSIKYQLNPDKPDLSLTLIKLTDDILHVLDSDGKLMIGNEFFSYTLSRTRSDKTN